MRKLHVYSNKLIEKLAKSQPNDEIEYTEMISILGKIISRSALHGYLHTAKEYVRKNQGLIFKTIHSKGIKCLNDESILDVGINGLEKINRQVKRTAKKTRCIKNYPSLPSDKKNRLWAINSLLVLVDECSTPKSIKMVENKCMGYSKITFDQTIRLFTNS